MAGIHKQLVEWSSHSHPIPAKWFTSGYIRFKGASSGEYDILNLDMTLTNITSQVNLLLPKHTYLATGKLSDYQRELSSIEENYICKFSPSRKKEFRAGRSIAKEAAKYLGIQVLSISRDNNGCPVWPAPVVGSISHKKRFCGALLGYRDIYTSIGLDIELPDHLQNNVWSSFTTAHEIEQANACNIKTSAFANLIYSAKEAFFKCLFPLYYPASPNLTDIIIVTKSITHNDYGHP